MNLAHRLLALWRLQVLISKKMHPLQLVRLGVVLTLVLLCLYLGFLLAMQFNAGKTMETSVASVQRAKPLYWDWFRGDSVAAVLVVDQRDNLADAAIDAELLGVLITPSTASATVKFRGRREEVFHKGDKLAPDTTIIEIEAYRIVVKQNGINKQVLLKKPDIIMETEQSSPATQSPKSGFALANMFGAVPVNVSGGSGLKLNNLSDEMKILADIRDGDVVIAVDGMAMGELMANPAAWMGYSSSSSLPVTVIREGQEETIYVNAASLYAKMLP